MTSTVASFRAAEAQFPSVAFAPRASYLWVYAVWLAAGRMRLVTVHMRIMNVCIATTAT